MNEAGVARLLLTQEIALFLYAEAELLDERRHDEWLALLADDIRYWMPMRRNVKYGDEKREFTRETEDISWFDEGKDTLTRRVRQIQTGIHWAEEPQSRITHMVSNVICFRNAPDEREVVAKSRFLIYRNRVETETDLLVGKREDTLRRAGDGWLIARRKIMLDQNVLLTKNLTFFFKYRGHGVMRCGDIIPALSIWCRGRSAARSLSMTTSMPRSRSGCSPGPGCLSGMKARSLNPGDFFVSRMGEESVILCRDRAGAVHVFLNSCRHRGMKVCRYDDGNTTVFTCPYHGWSYGTDGALVGVPFFREAYHSELDKTKWRLVEVAQSVLLQGHGCGRTGTRARHRSWNIWAHSGVSWI